LGYDDSWWDKLSEKEKNAWKKNYIASVLIYEGMKMVLMLLVFFVVVLLRKN